MKYLILIAALCLPMAGPAQAQLVGAGEAEDVARELETTQIETGASEADPWEGFNRKMFAVNNTFDRALMVPAAKAYRAVTHKKQRKGIRNFLANLRTPVTLVNDILQGEFGRAGETAGRFVINSTIGFGGMGDPAERLGIEQHSEDFGQTLAVWGVDSGPYVVLPFFGPSTVRDGLGSAADVAADPAIWIRTEPAQYFRYSRTGANLLSTREPLIEPLADIEADSLDFYASIRSFYLQSRKREIANGRTTFDDLPDIGEFEEFDEELE
ncbi:VacJ family lipoprotein [Hyphococcus flavus]|uniref:VacJ family lipoprotein n=1 Tax=Hyphococcus flavus TaxID=1866326 RepID=A0AAF0CF24_9PROT|nr:VacJ family lipoprotein [Hyphococcus flavus]WDI30373.1 VacJ family lipoprotein [Hyphococcus flavus]